MPAYDVELMPGEKPSFGDDPNQFKYQIREYEGAGFVKDKRYSQVRFNNLTLDEAHKMVDSLQGKTTE